MKKATTARKRRKTQKKVKTDEEPVSIEIEYTPSDPPIVVGQQVEEIQAQDEAVFEKGVLSVSAETS